MEFFNYVVFWRSFYNYLHFAKTRLYTFKQLYTKFCIFVNNAKIQNKTQKLIKRQNRLWPVLFCAFPNENDSHSAAPIIHCIIGGCQEKYILFCRIKTTDTGLKFVVCLKVWLNFFMYILTTLCF